MRRPSLIEAMTAAEVPVLPPRAWEDLLSQARRSLLIARWACRLADQGQLDRVPEGPRRHLASAMTVADRVQVEMRLEADRVRRALQRAGVRCVLLKGAAYLCGRFPAARGRVFGDIDILVPRDALARVEGTLLGGGWVAGAVDAYDQRYYREWMHELPPLTHVNGDSTIDVHHTITAPTSAFRVDGQRLLAAARPVDAEGRFWVLQPVDMVLHSAVHLFQEGEFDHGLRDLLDMAELLRHFEAVEPGFWPALFARARELALERPLHHALFHIERLLGPRVPPAWRSAQDALRPPWLQHQLMAWLLGIALRPRHPSARVPFEPLALWLLYLRSHWLRMPLHLLLPHLARKAWRRRIAAAGDTAKA